VSAKISIGVIKFTHSGQCDGAFMFMLLRKYHQTVEYPGEPRSTVPHNPLDTPVFTACIFSLVMCGTEYMRFIVPWPLGYQDQTVRLHNPHKGVRSAMCS